VVNGHYVAIFSGFTGFNEAKFNSANQALGSAGEFLVAANNAVNNIETSTVE
jgi:hypothetical protein